MPHNHEIGLKCVGNRPVIQSIKWLFLESPVFQLTNLSFIYLLTQTILSTVAIYIVNSVNKLTYLDLVLFDR